MSYTKRTDTPCAAAETVVQLDSGQLVAVQCIASRTTGGDMLVFTASARWVDAQGVTQCDSNGREVSVAFPTTLSPEDVTRLGAGVITKECLMLVLGEPLTPDPDHPEVTVIRWAAALVAQCSIRNAIASASVTAPDAGEVL